jgi:hypothetical protein
MMNSARLVAGYPREELKQLWAQTFLLVSVKLFYLRLPAQAQPDKPSHVPAICTMNSAARSYFPSEDAPARQQ